MGYQFSLWIPNTYFQPHNHVLASLSDSHRKKNRHCNNQLFQVNTSQRKSIKVKGSEIKVKAGK